MLTVPTTPRTPAPGLPDPGGWAWVCLHLVTHLRTPAPDRKAGGVASIIEGIPSYPITWPASKNP